MNCWRHIRCWNGPKRWKGAFIGKIITSEYLKLRWNRYFILISGPLWCALHGNLGRVPGYLWPISNGHTSKLVDTRLVPVALCWIDARFEVVSIWVSNWVAGEGRNDFVYNRATYNFGTVLKLLVTNQQIISPQLKHMVIMHILQLFTVSRFSSERNFQIEF